MLSVGDVSNLEMALENTIKVVEGVRRMKEPVISAVSYPLFLLFMVVLLIYGVGASGSTAADTAPIWGCCSPGAAACICAKNTAKAPCIAFHKS